MNRVPKLHAIGDVHLGNHRNFGGPLDAGLNDRARAIVAALRDVRSRLERLDAGPGELIVLGDLFDTHHPTPQLVDAAMEALNQCYDIRVHLLLGNHDAATDARGDHALAPFRHLTGYEVHDRPAVVTTKGGDELVLIPYRPGVAREWLPEVLGEILGRQASTRTGLASTVHRVLALHLGVHDVGIRARHAWAEGAHDAVSLDQLTELCGRYRISAVMAGNWHLRQTWAHRYPDGFVTQVMQVGALVPTGWDNPGRTGYGTIARWTKGELTHEVVHGPRFVDVASVPQLATLLSEPNHDRLYVRWKCAPVDVQTVRATLEAAQASGGIAGHSVLIDQSAARLWAREAATKARSATTLADALASYVKTMPLEADVDRDEVLDRGREYLGT